MFIRQDRVPGSDLFSRQRYLTGDFDFDQVEIVRDIDLIDIEVDQDFQQCRGRARGGIDDRMPFPVPATGHM